MSGVLIGVGLGIVMLLLFPWFAGAVGWYFDKVMSYLDRWS